MKKILVLAVLAICWHVRADCEDFIAKNRELKQKLEQETRKAAELYDKGKELRREKTNAEKTIEVMQRVLNSIKKDMKK